MTATATIVGQLRRAARILAADDPDRASRQNGVGFNSADGTFGHALAWLPEAEWSPSILRDAWVMLRKYRAQLASAGFDFALIPEPAGGDRGGKAKAIAKGMAARNAARYPSEARVALHEGRIALWGPYWEKAVTAARSVEGRAWDGTRNLFPVEAAAQVRVMVERLGVTNVHPAVTALAGWADEPAAPSPQPGTGVVVDGDGFRVYVPRGARGEEQRHAIRSLPARTWDKATESWIVPGSAANAARLAVAGDRVGLAISDEAAERIAELVERAVVNTEQSSAIDADIVIPGLAPGMELHGYQKAGVAYCIRNRRVLVAEEMGLGKSLEASATVEYENAFPCLVIMPAVAKVNWQKEIDKFFPGRTVAMQLPKTTRKRFLARLRDKGVQVVHEPGDWRHVTADYLLVNYDVLAAHEPELARIAVRALIFDEFHYCKNSGPKPAKPGKPVKKTKPVARTAAAKTLAAGIDGDDALVLGLTGTPIKSRPVELVNQLQILGVLDPVFGGEWRYKMRYCDPVQDAHGHWDFKGASHLDELHRRLRAHCYIRREKKDVTNLPPKLNYPFYVEPDPAAMDEYDRAEDDLLAYLADKAARIAAEMGDDPDDAAWAARMRVASAEQLVRQNQLRLLVGRAKIEPACAWVQNFLDTQEGRKVIVFAEHVDVVETIAARFKAPKIRGGVSTEARQDAEERFQTDPDCRVIVCAIASAGVALTLTAASDVLFVEMVWTPPDHDQASDRAHRLGQTQTVTAWWLIAEGTVDEDHYGAIERKRPVVNAVTSGMQRRPGESDAEFDARKVDATSVAADVAVALARRARRAA